MMNSANVLTIFHLFLIIINSVFLCARLHHLNMNAIHYMAYFACLRIELLREREREKESDGEETNKEIDKSRLSIREGRKAEKNGRQEGEGQIKM